MMRLAGFCYLLFTMASGFGQESLSRDDFGWGIPLTLNDDSAFYQFAVPQRVYEAVTQSDLGDLSVLNGTTQRVPHELVLPPLHTTKAQTRESVELFPIYGKKKVGVQTLALHFRQRHQNGEINLSAKELIPKRGEVLLGHLMQFREEPSDPGTKRIQLNWNGDERGVHRVKVELSDDLEHWRIHNKASVLADLRFAGKQLRRDSIDLNSSQARYIRLTPVAGSEPLHLIAGWRVPVDRTHQTEPEKWALESLIKDDEGNILFELPGPMPGAWLEVLPKESNTFLSAKLYSKRNRKGEWHLRSSGDIYNLTAKGALFQQTQLKLNQQIDRYWKLVVDDSGGGFGTALPRLTWSWIPHQLLFSARGSAPFELVYGSGKSQTAKEASLHSFANKIEPEFVSNQVRLGDTVEIGGQQALSSRVETDWKQWSLWGVLILFTVLLGGLAWSTGMQMRQKEDKGD